MAHEAEQFVSEDESNCRHIEALNLFSPFVYSLKLQLGDQSDLDGKLEDDDKKTLFARWLSFHSDDISPPHSVFEPL